MESRKKTSGKNVNFQEDIKFFLKIKKVEVVDEKPFYKINNNKQFNLYDPSRRVDSNRSLLVDVDKIFTDEENSYIYEEVCRDMISEAFAGKNFLFMTYGVTHTSKKSILFGGKDCLNNITTKGIYLRTLEKLSAVIQNDKPGYQLNASFLAINKNKYLDLSNYMKKNISHLTEDDLINDFKKINKTLDFSTLYKKVSHTQASTSGDFYNDILKFYSQIMTHFYKLESMQHRLYSKSHFLFTLEIKSPKGELVSNLVFCLLAGSEKLSSDTTSYNTNQKSAKSEEAIYIQSSFINFITCLTELKDPETRVKNREIPYDEFTLTYVLKPFMNTGDTKYRIIGCTHPNTGHYDSVKDTLMFLLKCKKTVESVTPSSKSHSKTDSKTQEAKRDEVMYDLESKVKTHEKTIKTLKDNIEQDKQIIESNENLYKKNLEILKQAFNFEGDIVKLTLNDDYIKEAKYARRIRDSVEEVKYLKKIIEEKDKKFEDLQEENKKLIIEKRIVENDKVMVTMFTKLKEDNLHEENKLKILLSHSRENEDLKMENEILKKQIEGFKKDIEDKNNLIKSLPDALYKQIQNTKIITLKKEELKNDLEKKYKKTLNETNSNHQKEMKIFNDNFEGILIQKTNEVEKLKSEINMLKIINKNELSKYEEELVLLYNKFNSIIDQFRKKFDTKKRNVNQANSLVNLVNAKESLEKFIDKILAGVSRMTLPLLFGEMDKRQFTKKSETSSNFFNVNHSLELEKQEEYKNLPPDIKSSMRIKKQNSSVSASDLSENIGKISSKKEYTHEDLEKCEKHELNNIILSLQKNLKDYDSLLIRAKKEKRGYHEENIMSGSINNQIENLYQENERMRKRIIDQSKIINSNKVALESQERMLGKYSVENFINKKDAFILNTARTKFRPGSPGSTKFFSRPFTGKTTK